MSNQTFFVKCANTQILVLIPQSQIRKFLRCANPQMANPQIFATLSQNSPKSRLFKTIFCYIFNEKKFVFPDLQESANHKKDWVRKSQIRKCHICGRSAHLTYYLSLRHCIEKHFITNSKYEYQAFLKLNFFLSEYLLLK